MLAQFGFAGGDAFDRPVHLAEEPFVVAGFLVDEEVGKQGVGGVFDRDHDADRAVVLGHDDGFPAGGVEEFAEVVLGVAGCHDFHFLTFCAGLGYVHCSYNGHSGKVCRYPLTRQRKPVSTPSPSARPAIASRSRLSIFGCFFQLTALRRKHSWGVALAEKPATGCRDSPRSAIRCGNTGASLAKCVRPSNASR